MINNVTWRRRIALGVLAVVLGGGLYYGFRQQPITVEVGTVHRAPLRIAVEQEGRTRVVDRYVITAPVSAYARRITLEVGDSVQRGAPVALLEPQRAEVLDVRRLAEARSQVSAAEANVGAVDQRQNAAVANAELARKSLERARELRSKGFISIDAEDRAHTEATRADADLRSAQFSVATARHQLEAARTALRFAASGGTGDPIAVTSPVAGQVLKIAHKSEGPVAAGQALVDIGDPRELEVEVDVLSADAVRMGPGTRVVFERWGGDGNLEGKVRRVEPAGFTKVSALGVEEQRVWIIVGFTSPRALWERLGDAYRVEANFILWEGNDVLQLPASSLFRDGNGWATFVVEDGRARKRHVDIGQRGGLAAQVRGGLREGEQVIVHPEERLRDGVRVTLR